MKISGPRKSSIVVNLLYGCGLRLFECLGLRVQNFNFEDGILTVHGKGDKDRSVPLPQRIMPELKDQLETVSALHEKDLAAGYSDVFLRDSLGKKYPAAAKEFIWQWFFPQKNLTPIPGTKELRRYHLHESQVQEALKKAVRRAKLTKRVTSHIFRHSAVYPGQKRGHASFAGELRYPYDSDNAGPRRCENDDDTHCVPSKTVKEAKSPPDF